MKRLAGTLMVSSIAVLAGAGVASAQDYPPRPNPVMVDPATIDVAAFSPVCQSDIPYISYNIQVSGTDATTATLTFIDNTGAEIQTHSNVALSGTVIYPGASEAPDWPGWKFEDGFWVEDPSDANWRDGLTVRVEVPPTATGSVSYPPATAACNGPEASSPPPGADPAAPTPESASPGALPPTGSNGVLPMVVIAGGLLGAGTLLFGSVRRRKTTA